MGVAKHFVNLCITFAVMSVSLNAYSWQLTTEQKLSDYNQLVSAIESGYGPLHYKTEAGVANVDQLIEKYRELVVNTKTNSEFYYLIVEFVAEFKDGHFGAYIPSNYIKWLPITTDLVGGKILITNINRNRLPKKYFNFEVGDEVVGMDRQSAEDLLDQLQRYVGSGYELSVRRFASWYVFFRHGSRLPVPASDSVTVNIRRGESDIIETVKLKWNVAGTPLDEDESFQGPVPIKPLNNNFGTSLYTTDYDQISMDGFLESFSQEQLDRHFMCSGKSRIAKPEGATIIMEEPFVAYYYPTSKGNIGYLRIPHYSPRDKFGQRNQAIMELRYSQYEYAVRELEKHTVGMVIDQDHNCGGSVLYLEKILGLFMNKDYEPIKFTLMGSKPEYMSFKSWADGINKNTVAYGYLKEIVKKVKTAWLNGEFMTPMTSIFRGELYKPSPYAYTKPILVLIDETSGSGGDAFPSMIHGFGRAKLLGTRTSGLGGHVQSPPSLFYSGINLRMTKSLFYRPDGVAVENNGAVPDIQYSPTREDVIYQFKPYREFYTKEILKMIN